jgi:hypothetical protein
MDIHAETTRDSIERAGNESLRELVFDALDAAGDNGFDFRGWTAKAIADDLNRFCPDLDHHEPGSYIRFVKEWMNQRDAEHLEPPAQ